VQIETTRFGKVSVDKVDILHFPDGILGFENHKDYFLFDPGDDTLILWLQSATNPEIAFPVLEPKIFNRDYKFKLTPNELEQLSIEKLSEALVFSIITIPDDVRNMSANMKAPLVINAKNCMGRQAVLSQNEYSVKHSIFNELKAQLSMIHSRTSDETAVGTPEATSDINDHVLTVLNPREFHEAPRAWA
jgi:flagellar assembly factor FliW